MTSSRIRTIEQIHIDESLEAFVAGLYRIFHCAALQSIPTLERFKYLYFTDELIREKFKQFRMSDETLNLLSSEQNMVSSLGHFQQRLSHFITQSHTLLEYDLLPQLAKHGFVYQKINETILDKNTSLLACLEKINWTIVDCDKLDYSILKKLPDGSINYWIIWKSSPKFSILSLRNNLEQVVVVPALNHSISRHSLIHIDDLLKCYLKKFYRERGVEEIIPFRLTVDGLYEKNVFLAQIADRIALQTTGPQVKTFNCLEIEPLKSIACLQEFLSSMQLPPENCYIEPNLHQAGDFFNALISNHPQCSNHLLYPPLQFKKTFLLASPTGIFSKISATDILFHHPYQPFDEILDFFAAAAMDDWVTEISMTIFRIDTDSALLESLKLAVACGKRVQVLIELRVLGYTENHWVIAQELQAAGIEVFFGEKQWVTHAKMTLVTRETPQGTEYYSHLSTGNYHQENSTTYCDLGLLTSHVGIGKDLKRIFKAVFSEKPVEKLYHVVMSPGFIRKKLLYLIKLCKTAACAHEPASIFIKVKNLSDLELVTALNEAAQCGVVVTLFITNMSLVKPHNSALVGAIKVISYAGRLLEHHRIYCFNMNAQEHMFLGSCNLTKQHIDKRIELIFPIYQRAIQNKIKEEIIENIQCNTNHCWEMDKNGEFQRIENTGQDYQTILIQKYKKN